MGRRSFAAFIFVAVWIVVLSVPSLRLMLRGQLLRATPWATEMMDARPNPVLASPLRWLASLVPVRETPWPQLTARYPDDARVQLMPPETSATNDEKARNAAEVLRRFPDQAWLHAYYLRVMSVPLGEALQPRAASSGVASKRPQLGATELQSVLEVAQLGTRLEPDNGFFDWMRSAALLAAGRDDEALSAFRDAARKPHYDDHVLDEMQARLHTRRLAGPVLAEEEIETLAATLLPHLALHRYTAQRVLQAAEQAERAGRHDAALRQYGEVLQASTAMFHDSREMIQALVALNLVQESWCGAERKLSSAEQKQRGLQEAGKLKAYCAREFAAYANQHGRPDLAATALKLLPAAQQTQNRFNRYIRNNTFFGLPARIPRRILALWWQQAALLPQLLINGATWLGLLWLARRMRHEADAAPVRWLNVLSSTLVCGSAAAVFMLVANGIAMNRDFVMTGEDEKQLQLLTALVALVALAPVLLAVSISGLAVRWRYRKIFAAPSSETSVVPADSNTPVTALRRAVGWTWLRILFVCWFAFLLLLLTASIEASPNYQLPLALALVAALAWLGWQLRVANTRLPAAGLYAVNWLRHTLAALLILASLAYLVFGLAALPPRRAAEAAVERYIQQGEVAIALK